MAQTRSARLQHGDAEEHRADLEPSPRWVRVKFNGETIADTRRALLMLETRSLPVYYLPPDDVRMDLLESVDHHTTCPIKGEASYWNIRVGDRVSERAVWSYLDPLPGVQAVKGYLAFYWKRVDAWFEEEEQIFAHPRNPYHRVDAIQSSRHVRVEVGGQTVAETRRPVLLFETGLPVRYYFQPEDVRLDLLERTETESWCAYKGHASVYWRAKGDQAGRDVAWSYPDPLVDGIKVKDLIAFFNERVDAIYVDGELQARPQTSWSQ